MTCLVLGLALQGCQTVASPAADAPPPKEDFVLTASMDKSVYRPGEAVRISISLMNNTEKSVSMRQPDAASLGFFFGRTGDPERMRRDAVSSKNDSKGAMLDLAPGQTYSRKFLLTMLTHFEGPLSLQVHYDPNVAGLGEQLAKIYSNVVAYEVTGDKLFERDAGGMIMKQEAINIAQAQVPGDVQSAEAILVEDEKGFYKWWVNVQVQPPGQAASLQSFLIDPYIGKLWSKAKPFNPALAEDKRFQRPAGLPERGVGTPAPGPGTGPGPAAGPAPAAAPR